MRILIVEDNPVNTKILEMNLRKSDYLTVTAKTGKEALDCLRSIPDIELILADIMMPEMDGLAFMRLIKRHLFWKEIPIIMCTSLSDTDTVKKAIEMGCTDYLLKPIDGTLLLQKVRKALDQKKQLLRRKDLPSSELQFDFDFVAEIIPAFASQIREKMEALERHLQEEPPPAEGLKDLFELREGAILLQARDVIDILDRLAEKGDGMGAEAIRSEYGLLLNELKSLHCVYGAGASRFSRPVPGARRWEEAR